MKAKVLYLIIPLLLTGCFLFSTPTATVKSFVAAMEKGDVDGMTKLFSGKATQKSGLNKIRENNQILADTAKRALASGSYRMESIVESSTQEGSRVSFLYKGQAGTDSIKLVFNLSKEGSAWKIDSIGEEMEGNGSPIVTPNESPVAEEHPPPPPGEDGIEPKTDSGSKTISAGVLNGKAINLPKPPYPPSARAVHASGTVVVQVVVNENGDVVSANAISGHPLLRAAAMAAARGAKFSPTKLAGKSVKVNGVINYNFFPE